MAMGNYTGGLMKKSPKQFNDVKVVAQNQISIGDTVYTIQGEDSQFITQLSNLVNSATFSPNGNMLILGGQFSGYAKIYSVSGTTVTYVSDIYADTGTTALSNLVNSATFSPDGNILVLGGSFSGYAKIYSVSSTTVTYISNIYSDEDIGALSSYVYSATFSLDGTKLVLGGSFTGKAKIYSVYGTTVTFVSNIYANSGTTALSDTVSCSSFSPDGTKLVLGGYFTGRAKIYSVSGTTVTYVSDIYSDSGTTVLSSNVSTSPFSPDGTKLALGGNFSSYAKIYSVSGTTVTYVSDIYADAGTTVLSSTVYSATFSPDGTKLVLGGSFTGKAKIYSVSGTTVTFVSNIYANSGTTSLSGNVYSSWFSPDGTKLVVGGAFTGYAQLYKSSDFIHPVVYRVSLKGWSSITAPRTSYSIGYSKKAIPIGSEDYVRILASLID